jgi:hypothetical protein
MPGALALIAGRDAAMHCGTDAPVLADDCCRSNGWCSGNDSFHGKGWCPGNNWCRGNGAATDGQGAPGHNGRGAWHYNGGGTNPPNARSTRPANAIVVRSSRNGPIT